MLLRVQSCREISMRKPDLMIEGDNVTLSARA